MPVAYSLLIGPASLFYAAKAIVIMIVKMSTKFVVHIIVYFGL